MKNILFLAILLATFGFTYPGGGNDLPNFYEPRQDLFTAGQPSPAGFDQLSEMGFAAVVNVLPERECIPGERGLVVSRGMKYYQVPFDPSGLNVETINHFARLLLTVERPLLVHCSTGNHAGGMWFAYRVLIEHASLPQAISEARLIGMQPAMEKKVLTWLADPVTRASVNGGMQSED